MNLASASTLRLQSSLRLSRRARRQERVVDVKRRCPGAFPGSVLPPAASWRDRATRAARHFQSRAAAQRLMHQHRSRGIIRGRR